MLPPYSKEYQRKHRRIDQKQKLCQRNHSQNILIPSRHILPIRIDNGLSVHGAGSKLRNQLQTGDKGISGSILQNLRLFFGRSQLFPDKILCKACHRIRHHNLKMIDTVAFPQGAQCLIGHIHKRTVQPGRFCQTPFLPLHHTGYNMRNPPDVNGHTRHVIGTEQLPGGILIDHTIILHQVIA